MKPVLHYFFFLFYPAVYWWEAKRVAFVSHKMASGNQQFYEFSKQHETIKQLSKIVCAPTAAKTSHLVPLSAACTLASYQLVSVFVFIYLSFFFFAVTLRRLITDLI